MVTMNTKMNRTPTHFVVAASLLAFLSSGCSTLEKTFGRSSGTSKAYSGYGSGSVDEKTLKAFEAPTLAPPISAFVQNIVDLQSPGAGMISPGNKKELFFTWTVTGTSQVWKLANPMAFPVQMTSGSDRTTIADFTADGKYLIVSRDLGGEEYPGLYLLPAGGGPLTEIFRKPKVQVSYAWSSNDGDTIWFMANDLNPESYALHSYSISTKKIETLFKEPGLWSVADTFGDKIFLMKKSKTNFASEYWVYRVGETGFVPIIGQNEMVDYKVTFGAQPTEFFVLSNKQGEFRSLFYAKDGKLAKLTIDEKNDIDDFVTDHMRFRVYIHRNVGGRTQLEVMDGRTFDTLKLPTIFAKDAEFDQTQVASVSRLGRYASVSVESAHIPRTSFVVDWASGKATQWTMAGTPEVVASQFQKSTLETFTARDGTKVPMFVTRPSKCAADPCPVIVSFHGGPEGQARPFFNRRAQVLAAAGFVFVEPNVRGSTGYGKSYLAADDGPKRLNVITDLEDVSLFIKKEWAKNGRAPKIGVLGGSYGGYATLMAMSRFAGAYDAGVSIVGMSNLETFLKNTAPYRAALRIAEYGDPVKDREALQQLSPITYIKNVKAPLLIIQGVNDPRVPAGEAIQMHNELKSRGVESSLILFPDEGHGATKRNNQVIELGHTLQFFQKNLLK
jgi:dipeptidyl aminopeptidase/acylaminoacyl peptidase